MTTTRAAKPLDVLIVEDRDEDADLMLYELKRAGFEPGRRRARSEEEFRAELRRGAEAILSDYTLPGFNAARALEICSELGVDIPFIVVTGSISEEIAVDCMKRGASDYLLKDRLARLGTAINQAIEAKRVREQKRRAEQARDAAMRELDHRVRNNLAAVVGLAELTSRGSRSLEEFSPTFLGRLQAMAAVHDALGEEHWLGADLASFVPRVVEQQRQRRGRLQMSGGRLMVPLRAVGPVGHALHELASNAVKFGAWSVPDGLVSITWARTPSGELRLTWQETGGPPLVGPAKPRAGLTLVENAVTHEAGGRFVVTLSPPGARAELVVPLAAPA